MDYDIVIVGSGPAGSSTALHLQRLAPELARRTLLLEQDRHPRHKLCAGALVADVDRCLLRVGLAVGEVPHVAVSWIHSLYEGRGFKMRLDEDIAFRIVQRTVFDGWLADSVRRRGMTIVEQTRVCEVSPIEGGAEVRTDRGTYRARVVVGADGAKSVVRRAVTTRRPGIAANVARLVEILTPAPSLPVARLAADEAAIELAWIAKGIQGYVWDFPVQRESKRLRNRGVYDSRMVASGPSGPLTVPLAGELSRQGQRLADYELSGAPLRWFDPRGTFAAPHLLLVGDAAGVGAVFGEGISIALGYGEIAARTIVDGFAARDLSFCDYRERILRSPMGRYLRRQTRIAKLVYGLRSPALQRIMWWHLGPLLRWYIKYRLFNWSR